MVEDEVVGVEGDVYDGDVVVVEGGVVDHGDVVVVEGDVVMVVFFVFFRRLKL